MPINLERAEKIGVDHEASSPKSNLLLGNTEVLTINKVPFSGVSFLRDGF